MSLRILVVTNMYPTAESPSFGVFVRDQVDDLREAGDHVDVFSFDGRRHPSAYLRAIFGLRRRVRSTAYDVVHAHYGLSGAVAVTQRRVPVVTTFHGGDTGYIPWQRRLSMIVARLGAVIVVDRRALKRLRVSRGEVVACGVDLQRFDLGDRQAARRSLGWDADAPTVILPGARANVRKGAVLFDAALDVVAQRFPDVVARSLEGFDRDGVRNALIAADVVLMTSEWEGSPVAVKEALACGTPVISVDVGDVADVLSELPPCAVRPRDPRQLGEAVSNALAGSDPHLLRARAETYGRPIVARRLHDALAAVAKRPR